MGAIRDYFAAIGRTVMTLGDGMAVTGSYFVRRPVTLQYPDRTPKPVQALLPERSRGLLEVDLEMCTGCALCEKTCPLACIKIEVSKGKERLITRFDIDLARCMHCGLCAECCPTEGLRHTREFEGGMYNPDLLLVHYVEKDIPVAKVSKDKPMEKSAQGSVLHRLLPDAWGKRNKKQIAESKQVVAKIDLAVADARAKAAAAAKAAAEKAAADKAAGGPAAPAAKPAAEKPAAPAVKATSAERPLAAAGQQTSAAAVGEASAGPTASGGSKGEA